MGSAAGWRRTSWRVPHAATRRRIRSRSDSQASRSLWRRLALAGLGTLQVLTERAADAVPSLMLPLALTAKALLAAARQGGVAASIILIAITAALLYRYTAGIR